MPQTEQQQADLTKIDEMLASLDADMETARKELERAAPARRLELNQWLRLASLGRGDLETSKRIIEKTGVPFDQLRPPDPDKGRTRKERDALLRRQYLGWQLKADERAKAAFAKRREEILNDIQSGKVDPNALERFEHQETPKEVIQRETREHSQEILRRMREEEKEHLELTGRQKRWPGGKGYQALLRGFGLHPQQFNAQQARKAALAESREERRRSHKSEAALRLELADKVARQRKGQK